jgi:pimeloyl-ACP methyl ester carboxylesterase
MDVLVADLERVIDRVAPEDGAAIVVGESFGGALSLSLTLTRPERVRALVILNSFPFFAPQIRLHLALLGLTVMPWGAMSIVRRLTAFRLHSKHTHRDEVRRFLELTERATREGYMNRLRVLTRYDVRARLGEIRCPALFLAADMDHLVPSVEQARLMSSSVPGSTLRVLEGHGHICLIAPDIDLERILRSWGGTA